MMPPVADGASLPPTGEPLQTHTNDVAQPVHAAAKAALRTATEASHEAPLPPPAVQIVPFDEYVEDEEDGEDEEEDEGASSSEPCATNGGDERPNPFLSFAYAAPSRRRR